MSRRPRSDRLIDTACVVLVGTALITLIILAALAATR